MYVFCKRASPIYFSFCRIFRSVSGRHFALPAAVRIPSASSPLPICSRLSPSRYSRQRRFTTSASVGSIIRCLSSSFVYPRKRLWLTYTSPFWYRYCNPSLMFWLKDWLSCCARLAMIVSSTSPLESIVLIFSFSKKTGMFFSFSSRIYFRQSSVFRAKRLIDFVIIISILPAIHSSIIRINSLRFLVLQPLIPSSANIPASFHSGFF